MILSSMAEFKGLMTFLAILVLTINQGCQSDDDGSNGFSPSPPTPDAAYSLRVLRHSNTSLSNPTANVIFADMNRVIQTGDGPNDVPCLVEVTRDGDVASFDTGNGTINSAMDFEAVNGLPGNIKVVNQINWCNGLAPNIIGCAPVPGDSLVVVRFDADLEGILWLHEFGHNQGLFHRNDELAVMNGTIDSIRREVDREECDAFLGLPGSEMAFRALMSGRRPMDVGEFVRQTFIHGVPYDQASHYGPNVVPTLLQMLKDPKEEKHWSNIVVTLGIIGDTRVRQPLINFIDSDFQGTLSRSQYTAKTSAIMALGYFVNKTGDNEALSYLVNCTRPTFWDGMQLQWTSPYHAQSRDRDIQLSTVAILGLALCGRSEASEALRTLRSRLATTETDREFQKQVDGIIGEALDTCEEIAKEGLTQYYRKRKHK